MKMVMEQTIEGKKRPGRPLKEKRVGKICLNIDHQLLKEWRAMCIWQELKLPEALEAALRDQLDKNKGEVK